MMSGGPTHIFISNNTHELQGALFGGRRWIIASSVGRAVGLSEPKSFGKAIVKKAALKDWKASAIAEGISLNRDEQLFSIQRRVLSSSLAAFTVAHMRLSEQQVSVFRMLMAVNNIGFDKALNECSMDDLINNAKKIGIKIS